MGVGRGIAGHGRYEVGDGEGASTEEDDEGQIAPRLFGKALKNRINLYLLKTTYNKCLYIPAYIYTCIDLHVSERKNYILKTPVPNIRNLISKVWPG